MRVSNHGEYNKFLQERGNIFHFVNEAIENWYENTPRVSGGNNIYSDKVVILIHIIVHLFRIGLRQAVGFVKGYMMQIGKNLKVISYTKASRRFKKLNLKIDDCRIDKCDRKNIEIAIDSTRVSIYNNNGGHSKINVRERKYNRYDQVRKLHVVLNINNKKAISIKYTNGVFPDYLSVCDMLKEISNKYNIHSIRADAAYDIRGVYRECRKYNIIPIIRPRKDTKICLADYLLARNRYISKIRSYESYEDGINEWKKKVKYGARSYIEAFFYRLKQIFGFSLKNKSEINREKELFIKCYLLNVFTNIGMAKFKLAT